jgi:hypothetical protein
MGKPSAVMSRFKVEFYIDSALKETDTVLPYRYDWSTAGVTPGPHQIKVIAYDYIDQTAEDEISITVTDDPPTVEITPPGQTPLSGTVTISAHAEDCEGVKRIQIYVDNVLLTSWNNSPQTEVDFDFQLNTTAYTNGSHTLKAVAIDTANQESIPAQITIVIEN